MHSSGVLLAMGAKRRRDREKHKKDLIHCISQLERQHKRSLSIQVANDLEQARRDLLDLLDSEIGRSLFYKSKLFFEHGNKSGRFLAALLRDTTHKTTVNNIRDQQGKILFSSADIAAQFRTFYEGLYNCRAPGPGGSWNLSLAHERFLKDSARPVPSEQAAASHNWGIVHSDQANESGKGAGT